jgi:uncharacterized protein YbaA (DUF1428 family)
MVEVEVHVAPGAAGLQVRGADRLDRLCHRGAQAARPPRGVNGALGYTECVGDDLKIPYGLGFPRMARLKAGETVVFSWIVYRSKAHRDRVNAKVMKDPRMDAMMGAGGMPFDPKRFAMGGFEVLVEW